MRTAGWIKVLYVQYMCGDKEQRKRERECGASYRRTHYCGICAAIDNWMPRESLLQPAPEHIYMCTHTHTHTHTYTHTHTHTYTHTHTHTEEYRIQKIKGTCTYMYVCVAVPGRKRTLFRVSRFRAIGINVCPDASFLRSQSLSFNRNARVEL